MTREQLQYEYNFAGSDFQRALIALSIAGLPTSPRVAWKWALVAAKHAKNLGVCDAEALLGICIAPRLDMLQSALLTPMRE